MNTKRKYQVVMLPTNKKSDLRIVRGYDGNALCYDPLMTPTRIYNNKNHTLSYHHLYIISDEEMKEGDYVYVACSEVNVYEIRQITEYYNGQFLFDDKSQIDMDYCKKIIATTDNLRLICKDEFGGVDNQFFPQPPQQFIEDYIKEYNKGNVITDVEVEYEKIINPIWESYFEFTDSCMKNGYNEQWYLKEKLKVNPDNTINIKPTKDSWSREEVKQLLNKFSIDCFKIAKESVIWGEDYPQIVSDKWIEQNI